MGKRLKDLGFELAERIGHNNLLYSKIRMYFMESSRELAAAGIQGLLFPSAVRDNDNLLAYPSRSGLPYLIALSSGRKFRQYAHLLPDK
jgi:hypothetical protein